VNAPCALSHGEWESLQPLDDEKPDEIPNGAGHNERVDSIEHPACHSTLRFSGIGHRDDVKCDTRNGLLGPTSETSSDATVLFPRRVPSRERCVASQNVGDKLRRYKGDVCLLGAKRSKGKNPLSGFSWLG